MKKTHLFTIILLLLLPIWQLKAQPDTLKVGVAGSPPFVIRDNTPIPDGISVEIWKAVAENAAIPYRFELLGDVSTALDKLNKQELDIVVGSISITNYVLSKREPE